MNEGLILYHDNDFNYIDWVNEVTAKYTLPPILSVLTTNTTTAATATATAVAESDSSSIIDESSDVSLDKERDRWQEFYHNHETGRFYKPRRYLSKEFASYLPLSSLHSETKSNMRIEEENYGGDDKISDFLIFEVGCGHGCSIFPLLKYVDNRIKFIATDFSDLALTILNKHEDFDGNRVLLSSWNILNPAKIEFIETANVLFCIFVLSAINPKYHQMSLRNLIQVLKKNGYILFRDYAEHDMTMYRHILRLGDRTFRRNDGTLVYYFSQEYFRQLATDCGLEVIEVFYATVTNRNRSSNVVMNRVFLHAVLCKK